MKYLKLPETRRECNNVPCSECVYDYCKALCPDLINDYPPDDD